MITAPSRVLVIALRRLGDVLLTTALIRSLRHAYQQARVEALVFAGTEGILAGNRDLDAVITMPARPTAADSIRVVRPLWRRYDLAVSTQTGDRPTFMALAAASHAVLCTSRYTAMASTRSCSVSSFSRMAARVRRNTLATVVL